MSKYQNKFKQKNNRNNFKNTELASALLGVTSLVLCMIPANVWAANECGAAPIGGGTINCTASGNNYNAGILYPSLVGNYNINFDSMILNKVGAGPNYGVIIHGTGNQTYNMLGSVDITVDGRGPTTGVYGMELHAAGAGNTLTFNANDPSTNFNLKVLGAGPDSDPGLTGILLKADKVVADLSKATIYMEGGNVNGIGIFSGAGISVNSIDLVTGNITVKSHSNNFPDYDAAIELEASENIKVNTSAGTIKVTGSSVLGPSLGMIGVRAITHSNTNGVEISTGNIDLNTDKSVGAVAYRTAAAGSGTIKADTVVGTEIRASGKNSIGIELNNTNGTTNLTALGSVLTKGENGTAIRSLSQQGGPVFITVGTDATIEGGWSVDPLINGGTYNPRNVNDLESKAAIGILLGAGGSTSTVQNNGRIGAGTDRAIETLETSAGLANTTTIINNAGEITGTMKLGSGNDVFNNTGSYNLRGFADTDGDEVRDHFRVAVTDFGAGTANQVNNSGVITLLGDNAQATTLNNTGEYATGYAANTLALGGAAQGQILGVQTFTNSGVIDLSANSSVGDVLLISGSNTAGTAGGGVYIADGGQIKLDTVLNEGGLANSQSDMLVVDSTRLGSGATSILLNNVGGAGANTVDNGIEVVRVLDSANSAAGVFKLGARTTAGLYEYDLFKGDVDANVADGNWYLRSLQIPGQPDTPAINPESTVYLRNLNAASTMFMHTLHDRLGEPQFTDPYKTDDNNPSSAWVRVVSNHTDSIGGNGQVDLNTDTNLVHLGTDIARWSSDGNDRWLFGVMGAYGQSKIDASAKYFAVTPSGFERNATGKVDGYSVGAYATWYGNKDKPEGPYVDTWAQYGWYDNKVQGNTKAEESYNSSGWTASVEAGYAMVARAESKDRQWIFEPQVQVAYNNYTSDDHTDASGTRITDDNANGVITRVGARLYGRSTQNDNGIQPFVEANWWYSDAKNSLSFNGQTMEDGTPDSRYEVKVGLQGQVANDWLIWGHAGVQFGSNEFNRYEGMVGIKRMF